MRRSRFANADLNDTFTRPTWKNVMTFDIRAHEESDLETIARSRISNLAHSPLIIAFSHMVAASRPMMRAH